MIRTKNITAKERSHMFWNKSFIAKLSFSWKFHWNWAKLALVSSNTTPRHPTHPPLGKYQTKPRLSLEYTDSKIMGW